MISKDYGFIIAATTVAKSYTLGGGTGKTVVKFPRRLCVRVCANFYV